MSDQALPPDPLTQTKNRMAELAANSAKHMAENKLRSMLKGYLPKILWPLIPGERGTVEGNVKNAVSKWMWGVVGSIVFSLVFFGLVAIVLLGVAATIGFAFITS